ncbi:hypothetical protein SAMN05421856_103462 [Chryseobacterium taichungense]|uniref:Uncharacterized protein n=1 Tax=Chryseobacterium taichungense TaxID=295069 RepID=A0A1H7YS43_9FLAO|nr:hypothetical protein [Chryseobacterium taichungense]SEM48117.1 hypothetical protein SAMN05421856_103462 [Chryseobacterium taichungense]
MVRFTSGFPAGMTSEMHILALPMKPLIFFRIQGYKYIDKESNTMFVIPEGNLNVVLEIRMERFTSGFPAGMTNEMHILILPMKPLIFFRIQGYKYIDKESNTMFVIPEGNLNVVLEIRMERFTSGFPAGMTNEMHILILPMKPLIFFRIQGYKYIDKESNTMFVIPEGNLNVVLEIRMVRFTSGFPVGMTSETHILALPMKPLIFFRIQGYKYIDKESNTMFVIPEGNLNVVLEIRMERFTSGFPAGMTSETHILALPMKIFDFISVF